MGVNKLSLLKRKLFLLHGLSTLVEQDTQFASVPFGHMLSSYVTRSRVEAGSTAFLDDIHRSPYQSHQDLIPNVLGPLIDHLFRTTLTSSRKSSMILVFPSRTYTIWTRRVVRGVVERMVQLGNISIHTWHVQSTSLEVETSNLLPSLNVFRQMERTSCLDLFSKANNMTQSGLKLALRSHMYCLFATMSLSNVRLVIALAFLQMDGQMIFYAFNGLKSPLFLRLLYRIHQGNQFFSSTMVMVPII